MKEIVHPFVVEHIQVLEEYFATQRELIEVGNEEVKDEFHLNSQKVRLMELDLKMDKLSERLRESVVNLGKIKA